LVNNCYSVILITKPVRLTTLKFHLTREVHVTRTLVDVELTQQQSCKLWCLLKIRLTADVDISTKYYYYWNVY